MNSPIMEITETSPAGVVRLLALVDMREVVAVSIVEDDKFVIVLRTGASITAPATGFESTAQTWNDHVRGTL